LQTNCYSLRADAEIFPGVIFYRQVPTGVRAEALVFAQDDSIGAKEDDQPFRKINTVMALFKNLADVR
jgi:hypothetical protein